MHVVSLFNQDESGICNVDVTVASVTESLPLSFLVVNDMNFSVYVVLQSTVDGSSYSLELLFIVIGLLGKLFKLVLFAVFYTFGITNKNTQGL